MSTEPLPKLRLCKKAKLVRKFVTITMESIAKSTNGSIVISTTLAEQQHPNKQKSLRISSKIFTSVDRPMKKLLTNNSVSSVPDSLLTDS